MKTFASFVRELVLDFVLRHFGALKYCEKTAAAEKLFRNKLKPNGETSNCVAASKRGFSSHAVCEFLPDFSRKEAETWKLLECLICRECHNES